MCDGGINFVTEKKMLFIRNCQTFENHILITEVHCIKHDCHIQTKT